MVRPTVAPVPHPSERPYTGNVEIRVHGVSGTPPQELLGRSDVHQVAGDRLSGFYRPSLATQMRDEPAPDVASRTAGERGPWLEGYSWGGWTSGARSRVLWLALLPFALVNVSTRMLPPEGPAGGVARSLRWCVAGLLRVLALSLTVTMVQGAVAVSMVTVAWRCGTVRGTSGACHGLPSFVTDALGGMPIQGAVLLCAAVPLAVTGLLWLVSHHASARYENAPEQASAGRPDDAPQPLLREDLWRSGPVISRLRLLHVQAGIVSVLGSACWLLPGGTSRAVTGWLTLATFAVALVLVVRRPAPPYTAAHRRRIMRPARLTWALVVATATGLAWQVAPALAGSGPDGDVRSGSAGALADLAVRRSDAGVQDLFVGQAALLGVVAVLIAAARIAGAGRGRAMFVSGFAGFVVAMLAWLTGAMLTASLLVLVPAWLARPGFAFTPRQIATALADPATAGWFGDTTRSSGVGTAVGVAALIALIAQLVVRAVIALVTGGASRDRQAVRRDYPDHALDPDPASRRRARAIATMFWWARRVDGVPRGMAAMCLAVAALLAVQGIAPLGSGAAPTGWRATVLGRIPPSCRAVAASGLCSHIGLIAWGVFCTAGLGMLVLVAGVLAYRTRAARRGVGVFWDLACFWPRDTHPLAPPCYNERIMPQVSVRVAWYLGGDDRAGAADPGVDRLSGPPADPGVDRLAGPPADPGVDRLSGPPADPGVDRLSGPPAGRGRVVLAGHSQGSVIALAAAVIQPEDARRRLALVTVGCVLDRLYSRFFPRYFGPELFRIAADLLGAAGTDGRPGSGSTSRWTNIWRHSDYLGGSVPYPPGGSTDGPINVRSTDPVFDPPAGDTIPPAAGRHSDFWSDPVFASAVDRSTRHVSGSLRGADLSPTATR